MRQMPFVFLAVILLTAGAYAQDKPVKEPTGRQIEHTVDGTTSGAPGGVSISDSAGATPDASAILDVRVTNATKKGILIPRITEAERLAIPSPATGLLVFQTTGSSG